jgi:beta-galactosidase
VEGEGEIIATDNGDQTDFTPFPSHQRKLFSGKVLVIVRSVNGDSGSIIVNAASKGLEENSIEITSN